ncbi:phosphate-starvation-inducible PsiE family protein [Carbonactinospora thermoautotrophica]|nr:phosphate-starvation-inducible PsiE family protein [Carbonactinospora thermoautotrophica]
MSNGTDLAVGNRKRPDALLLRLLVGAEHVLLYLVSVALLILGGGVLFLMMVAVVQSQESWTERFIVVLEELLLILIIVEIFVTVLAHLQGARLQLEPFIVVGVIAVVRHILGIVVRLAVPMTPAVSQQQLIELAVSAGVAFVLVAALAFARWSQRRSDAT